MQPRKAGHVSLGVLALVALFPALSVAQTGAIGGVVKDTSGAVLPGVTVEATSPALIEKVRTATTDGQGVFRIVDLRPGVYAVTFSLSDFATVKREGIELSAGVTVTVNADLRVGTVAETITVSGQSPLVDIQNATEHRTMTRTVTDELPATRSFQILSVLIPGVVVSGVTGTLNLQDVGGSMGERNTTVSVHGSTDMPLLFDGMRHNSTLGGGGGGTGGYVVNPGIVEEIDVNTSGASSEAESSGVRANVIPKQGGNRFSGNFLANYANHSLQSNNLDSALMARGVTSPYVTNKLIDINPSFGGPLKHDKLWFYFSYRYSDTTDQPPGAFQNLNPAAFTYTPDRSQPALAPNWTSSGAIRVTASTSPNSKLAVYADDMTRCWCAVGLSSTLAYEATSRFVTPTMNMYQVTWNWAASNRLLIDVGETIRPEAWAYDQQPGVPLDLTGIFDAGTGLIYRANPGFPPDPGLRFVGNAVQHNGRASVTYVTGSNNIKMGTQWISGFFNEGEYSNTDSYYTFVNGTPIAVTYRTTPNYTKANTKLGLGIYVQDQWTRKRLTLDLGARFDYYNAYIPAQSDAAGTYVAARSFPAFYDLPNYKDVTPRLGFVYDVFGDAKTAIKGNIGRYVTLLGSTSVGSAVNPITAQGSTTRAWTDSNHDFVPQPNELGPSSNPNFGNSLVTTSYAPNTVTGWGTRNANWEAMLGIQRELRQGLSVEASYHRRWFENFLVNQAQLTAPSDYSPFCVTAPTDARLGGVSGQQVCGLYDIAPTKFGLNNALNVLALSDSFGKEFKHYNGVDLVVNARLPRGVILQGGTNTGRLETNTCVVVNTPQDLLYCDIRPPFQTQGKLLAIYPLPWWGLQTSATYQTLPGPQITASWAAPASAVTGLGRSLAGGAKSVTVPLIAPGTLYGDRMNQIDVRIAKNIRSGQLRVQPQLDLYNVLNGNAVLAVNNTYSPVGTTWQTPTAILAGRILKIGVLITF
jgi:hypothetical protein